MSIFDIVKEKVTAYRSRLLAVTAVSLMSLVQYASAIDLNATIGPK